MIGDQQKIVFVVCHGRDAALAHSVWEELKRRGMGDIFLPVSTGEISKEKFDQGPEEAMTTFDMPFRRLQDYGTKDISKILVREQASIMLLADDQELIRRSFVLASNSLGIPNILIGGGGFFAPLPPVRIFQSTKASLFRLTYNFSNIAVKYLYLLSTLSGLRWGPLRTLRLLARDIWIAVSVCEANCTFGCQAFSVASTQHKQALVQRGIDAHRIFVTGNPLYDGLVTAAVDTAQSINLRRSLGIDRDDKVILLLTSAHVEHGYWTRSMHETFVTGIVNSLSPILGNSVRLIIKIHPLENLHDYQAMLASSSREATLLKDVKLSDIIGIADVVIASYSATVLDACILHKPVIFLHIFNEPEYLPYVAMGLATGVYHLTKLKGAVEGLLYDRSCREEALSRVDSFLSENRQYMDGRATSRVVDLIFKLIAARGAS